MKHIRLVVTSAALSLSIALTPVWAEGVSALNDLTGKIERDYSGISHMSLDQLMDIAKKTDAMKDVLLIDVREEKEFAVSRIPNAIRVSPGVWTNSFLRDFRDKVKGKKVVFYCSVGVRSSKLAARVKSGLMDSGAVEVANLKGGIFAWHNKGFVLNSATGRTNTVHPYNSYWGRLLKPVAKRSYSPVPSVGARHQSIIPTTPGPTISEKTTTN